MIDHQDESNCDEPLGSVMAKAAEQGKALDDTDEVQADEVNLYIEQCSSSVRDAVLLKS